MGDQTTGSRVYDVFISNLYPLETTQRFDHGL